MVFRVALLSRRLYVLQQVKEMGLSENQQAKKLSDIVYQMDYLQTVFLIQILPISVMIFGILSLIAIQPLSSLLSKIGSEGTVFFLGAAASALVMCLTYFLARRFYIRPHLRKLTLELKKILELDPGLRTLFAAIRQNETTDELINKAMNI